MLSVIAVCSVFNYFQFTILYWVYPDYALRSSCSSIYGQCATLLKLLHSMFHHLRSTLYAFMSLSAQEFLTTLYNSLEA